MKFSLPALTAEHNNMASRQNLHPTQLTGNEFKIGLWIKPSVIGRRNWDASVVPTLS